MLWRFSFIRKGCKVLISWCRIISHDKIEYIVNLGCAAHDQTTIDNWVQAEKPRPAQVMYYYTDNRVF